MTDAVIDASSVVAVLQQEPGAELVMQALSDGQVFLSNVNYSEVLATLSERGMPFAAAVAACRELQFTHVPFSSSAAEGTARLRSTTRHRGLGLGDRACLALAIELGHRLLTTDRAWTQLDLPVPVIITR